MRVFPPRIRRAYQSHTTICARRAGTTTALSDVERFFTISQMPVVSSRYWNMVHGNTAEEASRDEEGLWTMRQLGRNMAWLLTCV